MLESIRLYRLVKKRKINHQDTDHLWWLENFGT